MSETALSLMYQVGILFLLTVPGILLKKCHLVPDGFGKGLSGFVLYIAQPALVFLAYLRPYDPAVLQGALWVLLFSVLAHALFAGAALLFFRRAPDGHRRMLRMATVFSNAAFMGIPLIERLFGETAMLYATIYNITFNLVLWSLGVYLCTHGRDLDGDGAHDHADRRIARKSARRAILRVLLHPVMLAAFFGLFFFFLPIETYVPPLLTDALSMLKETVAPLSMIVIGLRLADTSFRGFFREKQVYLFLALRHILLPLGVLALFKGFALAFPGIDITVQRVVLVLAACPAASSATMFAERYDCDAAYAGELVTLSTALSIVTMPALLLLV